MNFRVVFKLIGRILLLLAGSMVLPLVVALLYQESPFPFLSSILLLGLIGGGLSALPANNRFYAREGFFAVALIWLLTGVAGSLPFLFSGEFATPIDCIFESCSGFTTTGATILTVIEPLPKGILFWRAFTHWLGGMGVLVLATAIVPSLGIRSHYLTQAETTGPVFSKLVPKQSQTSKILYSIYFTLTVIETVFLRIAGMPWYDALIHSFSTAGTGGFSNRNASVGAYNSAAIELIIAIFILLFSVNFALHFLLLCRKFRDVLESDELRFFAVTVAGSTLLIAVNIQPQYEGFLQALRYSFFQVTSIISTTGFATADFVLWPSFSQAILVLLMFVGACAGSTGGGMKCSRILILLRSIRREINQIIHPGMVEVVKLDGKVVEEKVIRTISIFIGCYILVVLGAMLALTLDGHNFTVAFSSALTCVSNVGPGLDVVGPTGNFAAFSGPSKLLMSLCMIIGRLEIFPVLVLFSRGAWRKT